VVIYIQVVSADSDSDSDPAPDSSKKRAQPPAWNNPLSWAQSCTGIEELHMLDFTGVGKATEQKQRHACGECEGCLSGGNMKTCHFRFPRPSGRCDCAKCKEGKRTGDMFRAKKSVEAKRIRTGDKNQKFSKEHVPQAQGNNAAGGNVPKRKGRFTLRSKSKRRKGRKGSTLTPPNCD